MVTRRQILALFAVASFPSFAVAKPGWATAMVLAGVPNLFKVSEGLYRSAQPTAEGFQNIANVLGVHTVINLHDEEGDDALATGTGLTLIHIPTNSFRIFSKNNFKLVAALKAIASAKGPVLVHCVHGSDRTGAAIAAWRMVNQGWSNAAAADEMANGGFGYHKYIFNIGGKLMRLDVEGLKKQVAAR
jgi:protein tyrosine/serine phosphatase